MTKHANATMALHMLMLFFVCFAPFLMQNTFSKELANKQSFVRYNHIEKASTYQTHLC